VLSRLRQAGLLPRKGLGQHFLHDPAILSQIASAGELTSGEAILEVGTGPGTLTRFLSGDGRRVITVEVDPAMLDFAREELAGREGITFLGFDALDGRGGLNPRLRRELEQVGPFKLVSNLPYGSATPLLLAVLESGLHLVLAIVTVQKEVAERLTAKLGTRDYSPLTVLAAYWAIADRLRVLPPGSFWPPPRVSSAVVKLRPHPKPFDSPEIYIAYRGWVHRLLSQRRKQLGGLLRDALGPAGEANALSLLALEPAVRPDRVPPRGFLRLAREFRSFEFDTPVTFP